MRYCQQKNYNLCLSQDFLRRRPGRGKTAALKILARLFRLFSAAAKRAAKKNLESNSE
jgi:hypothetical protein